MQAHGKLSAVCQLANIPSKEMLKISEEFTDKLSVVRRLVFASAVLPCDTPHLWDIVSSFACSSECTSTSGSNSSTLLS